LFFKSEQLMIFACSKSNKNRWFWI
jgi:hypothetical protein